MAAFEENCLQFSFKKKIFLHIRYQDIWPSLRSLEKCLSREVKKKSILCCSNCLWHPDRYLGCTTAPLVFISLVAPVTDSRVATREGGCGAAGVFHPHLPSAHLDASVRPYMPKQKDKGSLQASRGPALRVLFVPSVLQSLEELHCERWF